MKKRNRETRGFSIYEHNIDLEYVIHLDKANKYFDTYQGTELENSSVVFKTDCDGYIYPSRIYENPDITIVFMGDSSVECTYVEQEKRYPYLVGRKLEQYWNKKINSFNAGVSGADTLSLMRVLLDKIFPEHPNIILFTNVKSELLFLLQKNGDPLCGANNGKPRVVYPDEIYYRNLKTRIKKAISIVIPLRLHSFKIKRLGLQKNKNEFLKSTEKVINLRTSEEIEGVCQATIEMFRKDLIAFISLCRCRNIPLVLMTQANMYNTDEMRDRVQEYYEKYEMPTTCVSYSDYIYMYKKCNLIIKEIAAEYDVEFIDLDESVTHDRKHIYDAVHYTNVGSKEVSDIIIKKMTNMQNVYVE